MFGFHRTPAAPAYDLAAEIAALPHELVMAPVVGHPGLFVVRENRLSIDGIFPHYVAMVDTNTHTVRRADAADAHYTGTDDLRTALGFTGTGPVTFVNP